MERLSPEELAEKVKQIYSEIGPLCDSEGFYNHDGECWNDALQMIFLNSDMIKEKIQSKLASGPIDILEVDSIFRHTIPIHFPDIEEEDITKYIGFIYTYLDSLQKRFHRHYYAEHLRLSRSLKDDVCTLEDMKGREALKEMTKISLLHRKGGEEGRISAYMGQEFERYNKTSKRDPKTMAKNYISGGGPSSRKNVMFILRYFFDIFITAEVFEKEKVNFNKFISEYGDEEDEFEIYDGVKALYVGYRLIGDSHAGHAVAFYTCGGRDYFFDDNKGSIQFPWKTFFRTMTGYHYYNKKASVFFDGKLYVKDATGNELFHFFSYPYLMVVEKDKAVITSKKLITFLWDGTIVNVESKDKTIDEMSFETTIKDTHVTFDFTGNNNFMNEIMVFKTSIEKPFVPGRANEKTGKFLGARLRYGNTKLYEVVLEKHLQKIREGKARIDDIFFEEGGFEFTPLFFAILMNDIRYVNEVLSLGADVEKRSLRNETPLFYAVVTRNKISTEILEALIKAGADLNSLNYFMGYTPIMGSVIFRMEDEDTEHVEFLVKHGADIHAKSEGLGGVTAIEFAKFNRRSSEYIDKLVELGARPITCPEEEQLLSANYIMDLIRSRKIIQAGLVAQCYREYIFNFSREKKFRPKRLMLDNENMVGDTPLKLALELPMNPWSEDLIDILLASGSNVNRVDKFGSTPLHYAISLNKSDFVRKLLDFGANLYIRVSGLGTPLEYAKRLGNQDVLEILEKEVTKKANLNIARGRKPPVVQPAVKNRRKYQFTKRAPRKLKGGKRKTRKSNPSSV